MLEKPRLLVLASTFPRWKDDTEPRFVYDLCQNLKNKFEITILAPHCKDALPQENIEGLEIIRYRYAPERFETLAYEGGITAKLKSNWLNWLIVPFFFLGQFISIFTILKKYPVKVIHAHWLIPQGIIALIVKLISKNKPAIICTSHGGDLYSLNDPISKSIKRYVINNVDKLTVVSSAMQDEILTMVPEAKLPFIAPMGTDLQGLFSPNELVPRKSNQLLFVGRLVEKKGLKYLLDIMPKIIDLYPNILLNIVGTGPEQKNLENQVTHLNINNNVQFLGRLSHKQLVKEYRKASISVFPFIEAVNGDQEGLGLVMIEAMGCGCPVIACDIPAVRDVIINGETGVLVEPKNVVELEQKVIFLMKRIDYRQKISKNALTFVRKKFDWKPVSEKYKSIFQSLT